MSASEGGGEAGLGRVADLCQSPRAEIPAGSDKSPILTDRAADVTWDLKKSWPLFAAIANRRCYFLVASHPASSFPAYRPIFPPTVMNAATVSRPLFERIHDALNSNPHVPCNQVRVEAEEGRVVLKGSVSSFFQKQMAQEAIRRVDGVQQIDNLLQVNWA